MAEPRYRTHQDCYLRLRGGGPDPVYVPQDSEVGPGTAFDFEGPPSIGMTPLNDAAADAHASMMSEAAGGPPLLKSEAGTKPDGSKPEDPAALGTTSDGEKARADAAKAKADADAKAKAEAESKAKAANAQSSNSK